MCPIWQAGRCERKRSNACRKKPPGTLSEKMADTSDRVHYPIPVEIDLQQGMAMPTHLRQHSQSTIRVRMLCSSNCKHCNINSHAISSHECPRPEVGSSWEQMQACSCHRRRPTPRNHRQRYSDPVGTAKITNQECCSNNGIGAGKRKKIQANSGTTTRRSEAHLTVQQSRRLIEAADLSRHSSPLFSSCFRPLLPTLRADDMHWDAQ